MTTTITLANDFHHTSTRVRPREGALSPRQVERVKRALCAPDCTCSGALGTRGPQERLLTLLPDGSALVERI